MDSRLQRWEPIVSASSRLHSHVRDGSNNLSFVFIAASVVLSRKALHTYILGALSSRQSEHGACITSRNVHHVCVCSWKESMLIFSLLG